MISFYAHGLCTYLKLLLGGDVFCFFIYPCLPVCFPSTISKVTRLSIDELSLDMSNLTVEFISRGYWLDFYRTLNGIIGTCIELGLDVLSQV